MLREAAAALVCCAFAVGAESPARDYRRWIPARWDGGPVEVARRAAAPSPVQPRFRNAIEKWYDPATLALLDGTPINCLLLTLSAGASAEVEKRQHSLVKDYARLAKDRGMAVVGIVYPGADPVAVAEASAAAHLDGLLLDGDFPPGFASKLGTGLLIPILTSSAALNTAPSPILAVQGAQPGARDLAESGIRAGASAEPWIESNIWLVGALRSAKPGQPVWIDQRPDPVSPGIYVRSVADAAVAGGRWIVSLSDELRARLFARETKAMSEWGQLAQALEFAEKHSEWRSFAPYGNVAIVQDTARSGDFANEYLNLVARRHVPYRLIERAALTAASLKQFQAAIIPELENANERERAMLRTFAESGGLLVAGRWLQPPNTQERYEEIPLGKGRIVVYKEDSPDPEALARDLQDLLEPELLGVSVFNVPSAITYVSCADCARQMLVQLLNYATVPTERVTIRVNGTFQSGRYYTPDGAPLDLSPRATGNGRTEILIPRISGWGALVFESRGHP